MHREALNSLALLFLAGCAQPTEVLVEVTTDVACEDLRGVSIAVGTPSELEEKPPIAETTECHTDEGRNVIGSLMVIPSGEPDDEFGIKVVAGINKLPADCAGSAYEDGIVSRRARRFVTGETLYLPILLSSRFQREIEHEGEKTGRFSRNFASRLPAFM